jgi:uncharacterized protein
VSEAPKPPAAAGSADRGMLEFLVCPVTRGPLTYDAARQELVSKGAGLAFPINNGIPVMLVDEARRLED